MHGRPRKGPPSREDAESSAAEASVFRSLQSLFLQNHHNSNYCKEALDVSAKILEISPDWITAWNYRKLAVEENIKQSGSDAESIKSVFDHELRVVESALKHNYKSYGAWQHRKWVLSKGHSSIDRELKLLNQFQNADCRNFHAWSYRRFVAALKNISDDEELKFTINMININFSNYSAWHNRSVLLSRLLNKGINGFSSKEKVLTEEYNLVHQALFTDPDDQSGWFYHLWLFNQTVKPDTPLLVSSWPAHGSDMIVPINGCLDASTLSPFSSFYACTRTFPVILYFDQAVDGVNSSTVTVDSVFVANKDLVWRPLSTLNSSKAQVWVTQLNLPHQFSEPFSVEVRSSLHGSHQNNPRLTFTVRVHPDTINDCNDCFSEQISWGDEHFQKLNKQCEELILAASFDQLKINNEHDTFAFKWLAETIDNEIALLRELSSEFSIDFKFAKLSLARLLMARDTVLSFYTAPFLNTESHLQEVLGLYSDLMKLDLPHAHFYKDQHSLVLLRQVTSSKESLLKHCFVFEKRISSCIGNSICLRLNNLSLTRIGSVERLLWVQILDLSNNELTSIAGLEAMQVLRCLNLSHNKLRSFLTLAPLKLVKSLRVLDVRFNEIGMHSVDSARYLCSSPLCGRMTDFDEKDRSLDWEAVLVFKDLNLAQLDVVEGNAIGTKEHFRSSLFRILPQLRCLDGRRLH